MTLRRTAACSALGLLALTMAPAAQDASERARQLFLTNCATCHGETGDGKGVTQLDRPARSFMDGGFSFGNTPEALFRTISVGIPGTPMPGFDSSLSEADRHVLASYVVTLGPPVEVVKDEDMILAVHDRPLIVRGLLPSLGEGLPTHPRGLLIGDPTGITFEYRVDDVRLLALRQGGFVKRTDWTGRGGTALEPLGKVVHQIEGGKPEPSFTSAGRALTARLSGTTLRPVGSQVRLMHDGEQDAWAHAGRDTASIEYHLRIDGRELAHAMEIPSVESTAFGTGYQRGIWLEPGASPAEVSFRTPALESAEVLARGGSEEERWLVARSPGSPPVFVALGSTQTTFRELRPGQIEASLTLKPGTKSNGIELVTLLLVDWKDDIRQQLERWWEER